MELFVVFCVLNVINVILQTIKSLVTINCGKWSAAGMNAVAFGVYQVILVYAVCDLPLLVKVSVVAVANFVGVFITKYLQEKIRKDKLWKIEFATPAKKYSAVRKELEEKAISFNATMAENYYIFNCFCPTQKDSLKVKTVVDKYQAKYFVSESKLL